MINKYNQLFKELKEFIVANSNYDTKVVKNYTSTSAYFPIISCSLSNYTDTDFCTIDMIEKHQEMYLTIDIYTKNKTTGNLSASEIIASQEINDELTELVIEFLSSKNMKITLCRLTPNADTSITRRTIQCQSLVSLARGNIIRRWKYV